MGITIQEQKYYAEVYNILIYLGPYYTKRLPRKLIDVIDKVRDKNSTFKIDKNKPLHEQNICQETKDFIAALNLLYWEKDDGRKDKLLQYYKKNDIIYEKEQQEKYSYENLFKNNKTTIPEEKQEIISESNNNQLVEIKETFMQKIINKIKEIFRRFKR